MSTKRISKNRIKAAIPGSGGLIAVIAKRAGYSWGATRDAIVSDPELSRMVRDEEEIIDDIAESTVINKIRDGDDVTARWWLARRRRSKFGDNVDVTSGGQSISVSVNWRTYNDDEINRD